MCLTADEKQMTVVKVTEVPKMPKDVFFFNYDLDNLCACPPSINFVFNFDGLNGKEEAEVENFLK